MQNSAPPLKKRSQTSKIEEPNFDAKNKKRVEKKRLESAKAIKINRIKEQIMTSLVIVGLLTLIVASLLKGGLYLTELVASSAIIGGVLFIRAFGHSTAHKSLKS